MRRRRRVSRRPPAGSTILSLGDLFAGIAGVVMLVLLFLLAHRTTLESIVWARVYTRLERGFLAEIEYNGVYAESVICEPDGLVVPAFDNRRIPLADIATDPSLLAYLRELYGRGERILEIVHSGGNAAKNQLSEALISLGYYDVLVLRTHSNLEWITAPEIRRQFREQQTGDS